MNPSLRFALVLSLLFPAVVRLGAQEAARGPGVEKVEKMLNEFPEGDAKAAAVAAAMMGKAAQKPANQFFEATAEEVDRAMQAHSAVARKGPLQFPKGQPRVVASLEPWAG